MVPRIEGLLRQGQDENVTREAALAALAAIGRS
jgi:hypothetical protein